MKQSSIILLLFLLLAACNQRQADELLPTEAVAERLLQENPDSLAYILEEEIVVEELSDSARAEYGWWLVRLHQVQDRSLVNDTIIHETLRRYEEKQSERLIDAYLLAANQKDYTDNQDKDGEVHQLVGKAIRTAIERRDTAALDRISQQFADKTYYNTILDFDQLKQILLTYNANNEERLMTLNYALGCYYAFTQQFDSTKVYMAEAARLAEKLQTKNTAIVRNYADILNAAGDSRQALKVMEQFETLYPEDYLFHNITKTATYICTYLNLGQMDSVRHYLTLMDDYCEEITKREQNGGYNVPIIYIQKLLHTVYEIKSGKPLNILDIYLHSEKASAIERKHYAAEREHLYTRNLLEKKNLVLQIEKERSRRLVGFTLFATVGIILLLAFLYQRKMRKKEQFIAGLKEQMQWHQMELQEKEQQGSEHLAIIEQLSLQLILQHKELAKIHKGEYKNIAEIDWVATFKLVDKVFNSFTKRLRKEFPLLTEEDIQCCCMVKMQLTTSAIAKLYGIAAASATKRKQRIKERINQTKPGTIEREEPVDIFLRGY